VNLRFFSSPVGRCIETAFMIDKGNTAKGGRTESNKTNPTLAAFYVKDVAQIFKGIKQHSVSGFFRQWFNGNVPETVMTSAMAARDRIIQFLISLLRETSGPVIDIAVSHDWYMHVLKEYFLKQPLEEFGKVEYLEGAVLYEKNGGLFMTNHQSDPQPISI